MMNRLLGIIYILMNKGTVTAVQLSERFEVSVRTIYRDIEKLSMAGIPVYAKKGKNGGICLTDRFVLDKLLVSQEEQLQIMAALGSMEQTGGGIESQTLRKLGDFFQMEPSNWVSIDFSDWSGRRNDLFLQLKDAILQCRVMKFDYYGQYGEMTNRTVEPAQLLFKDYTWYLRAYCRERKAMRMFKILRMKRVEVTDEVFEPDEKSCAKQEVTAASQNSGLTYCQTDKSSPYAFQTGELTEIVLRIDGKEAYRVYDRFEEDEITVREDGDFLIKMQVPLDDWVYGMILSFGPSAEVIKPVGIREQLRKRITQMLVFYERQDDSE